MSCPCDCGSKWRPGWEFTPVRVVSREELQTISDEELFRRFDLPFNPARRFEDGAGI